MWLKQLQCIEEIKNIAEVKCSKLLYLLPKQIYKLSHIPSFMEQQENQNIEWKQSWHDEYIKWICGFANAQGGILFIGKDDRGQLTGLAKVKKLSEDIPNKILDVLGILVDVNVHTEQEMDYLEIVVEPYPYPVSYKGQYHYRSGSTKKELKGQALDKFLLQKQGKRWDGVPVPNIGVEDLKNETFELFRKKAAKSQRVEEGVLEDTNAALLENLHLQEGAYLKRAAILLFHPRPEKWVGGAYVKIGYFKTDDELLFQDEIHGNLFDQIEDSLSLLKAKYLKANIRYEDASRIEEYPFPLAAIREALLNAIAHKDYGSGVPVQISVYEHKILFWNEGQLPEHWTVERLKIKHPSKPFNPDVANALFRSGYIESWGRGTIKIINECKKQRLPPPNFRVTPSDIEVELLHYTKPVLASLSLTEAFQDILLFVQAQGSINNTQVQELCGVSKRTASRYLAELEEVYLEKVGVSGPGTSYVFKGSRL